MKIGTIGKESISSFKYFLNWVNPALKTNWSSCVEKTFDETAKGLDQAANIFIKIYTVLAWIPRYRVYWTNYLGRKANSARFLPNKSVLAMQTS